MVEKCEQDPSDQAIWKGGLETRYRNVVVERLEILVHLTTWLLETWDNEAEDYKICIIKQLHTHVEKIATFTKRVRDMVKEQGRTTDEPESFYSSHAFHEMGNPLAVIRFATGTLIGYWTRLTEEEKKRGVQDICNNGKIVKKLLESYLAEQRQKRGGTLKFS
jgi:hypothetical protein